jgi:hypothetical protein
MLRGEREFGGKVVAALSQQRKRRGESARRKRCSAGEGGDAGVANEPVDAWTALTARFRSKFARTQVPMGSRPAPPF